MKSPSTSLAAVYQGSARAYHRGRALNAAAAGLGLVVAAFVVPWLPGLAVVPFSIGVALYSWRQSNHPTTRPIAGIATDTVFIAAFVAISQPPAVIILVPVTVLVVQSILLLSWRQSTALFGVGLVLAASGLAFESPVSLVLSDVELFVASIMIALSYAPTFVFFVLRASSVLAERDELTAQLERRVRYEQALAGCSEVLLCESGEVSGLDPALEILMSVLDVDAVVVARNERSEGGEICRRVRRVINHGDRSPVAFGDMLMPWSEAPSIAAVLAQGQMFRYPEDPMTAAERQMFEGAGITSDVVLPIRVGGQWDGYLSFTDSGGTAVWDDLDFEVLPSIARMVGSYWTRSDGQSRLESLIDAKDEFVASVSHELRTPLTAVVGFTAELRDGLEVRSLEETRELIDVVAEQAREVAHIVEDLLAVARLDANSLVLVSENTEILSEITRVLPAVGLEGKIEVVANSIAPGFVDPGRFRQIVRNLLTNAVRYGGPSITCRVEARGDQVSVSVADDGDGIPEYLWEQVFEPYERATTSATNPSSVGLGLTVSRRLARLMGGDLSYRYEAGVSTFELTVPAVVGAVAATIAAG